MRDFILILSQLTLYTTVTAGVLILLKRLLRSRLPPLVHVSLWAVLLVRMLVPFLPESEISVYNRIPGAREVVSGEMLDEIHIGTRTDDITDTDYIAHLMAQEQPLPASPDDTYSERGGDEALLWCLGGIYIAGAAVSLILLSVRSIRARQQAIRASIPCEEPQLLEMYLLAAGKLQIPPERLPKLHMGECSLLCGVRHPVLILDHRTDSRDVPMILLHELNHFRHRDNLIILLANAASCLMWFNPLIWIARSCLRDDIEVLCDSRTLRFASVDHSRYAMLLYRNTDAERRRGTCASYMSAGGTLLKRRLRRIAQDGREPPRMRGIAGLLCAAVIAGCMTNPVSSALDPYSQYIETGRVLAESSYTSFASTDTVSGIQFYNIVYTTLKNRTGGDDSPLVRALGDGSLSSLVRLASAHGTVPAGFEEYMNAVAASQQITCEQAAVLMNTIMTLVSTESAPRNTAVVPVQIREETLAKVLHALPEAEAKVLLSCYSRGIEESAVSFSDYYTVETIQRVMQFINNEWLQRKFMSYLYKVPLEKMPPDRYADIASETGYDYVMGMQPGTSPREEGTVRSILALTEVGQRRDVFYLKVGGEVSAAEQIAAMFRSVGFTRAQLHEEYASLGYSDYDSSARTAGWLAYAEEAKLTDTPTTAFARTAVLNMSRCGIMLPDEQGTLTCGEVLTFGEVMQTLCLLYAGLTT